MCYTVGALKMQDQKMQDLKQCDSWPGLNRGYYSSGGHTRLRLAMEFNGLRIRLGIRMVAFEELFLEHGVEESKRR
jgi:hypothetical protein